jgi:hypothetical protein
MTSFRRSMLVFMIPIARAACAASAPPDPGGARQAVDVNCDADMKQTVELEDEARAACGESRVRGCSRGMFNGCSATDLAIFQQDAACERDACRAGRDVRQACGRSRDGMNWGCGGGGI